MRVDGAARGKPDRRMLADRWSVRVRTALVACTGLLVAAPLATALPAAAHPAGAPLAAAHPAGAVPVAAARRVDPQNVKYYVVRASFNGQPERLSEIAERLLGSSSRYIEILKLNYGRVQPDGDRLSEPDVLHPGWVLILPWDAVGNEVMLGLPPTQPAGPKPTPKPTATPTPIPTPGQPSAPAGGETSVALAGCVQVPAQAQGQVPWPQLRLAPDQAWSTSRGHGVTVAIVDLPIDASLPALAGRVTAALTVGTGTPVAASVCRDHGTGMAALVAGQPTPGVGLVGIAPEVTILPVTVDAPGGTLDAAQVAAGIAAGVRGGAAVVMVAAAVNLNNRAIAAAVDDAIAHDVAVVVGADPAGDRSTVRPGLLRVGAAAADDSLAVAYPLGAVDLVAPGAAVTTLGRLGSGEIQGSGTDFAVPFVAGLLALVRSASPGTSAVAATQHIESRADRHGATSAADSPAGWGMIDLSAAVLDLPRAPIASTQTPARSGISGRIILMGAIAALFIVGFALVRLRRIGFPPAA